MACINEMLTSRQDVTAKRDKGDGFYYFMVRTLKRMLLLRTRDQNEMEAWIDHIKKYAEILRVEGM